MKKINFKILIITCIVCLLLIFLGLVFYNKLPQQVAIHFDINNNPNSYFPKPVFVFGLPIMMVALQIFCCIISDLSDENKEANKKATTVFKWIIPILAVVLYIITIMYAIGSCIDIRKVVMIILGIIFIVMGNYLPKTKGINYVRGLKNIDEKTNKKMIRISGYMLIIDGLLSMITILFNQIASVVFIILVILQGIILYIYGLIKSKK